MLFFKLFSLFALVSVIVYQAHGGHEYSHQHFKLAKGHYHYKYKWNVHNHGYAKVHKHEKGHGDHWKNHAKTHYKVEVHHPHHKHWH